jgi:subtilisin family serine protease
LEVEVLKLSLFVGFVFLLIGKLLNAQTDKITLKLGKVLIHTPSEETIKVWIYFSNKGRNTNLDRIKNKLTEKAKRRRSKVMGDKIVDKYDIPINSKYINNIKSYISQMVVKYKWLNAISAKIKPSNIEIVSKFDFIKKIDVVKKFKKNQPIHDRIGNQAINIDNTYSYDYGNSFTQNDQINVPVVHDLGIDGSGVLICLLDNNYNLLNHETFSSMNIISTWDFINNDTTVNDPGEGTHGTQTLSTVGGWSPGNLIGPAFAADYILGKTEVNSFELPIEEDYWVAGAEWADSLGADVLSSSLGYIDWYTWQDMDGNTAVTTIGADIAVSRGIVVVNSAGNESSSTHNTLITPADGDSGIAVAAVTNSGARSSFSSIGPSADGRTKPDVAAMGSSVTVASTSNPAGYTTSSGTSFSCPLTSGVAALVLSANSSLTPMQVRDALRETASQASVPDNYLGWGILDAYEAVFYFNSKFTHTPLNDIEDLIGPYNVVATIESRLPLISSEIKLFYGTDSTFGNEIIMNPTGNPNEYSAQFSGTGNPSEYFYYLTTTNNQQIVSTLPFTAPVEYFRFYAGQDTLVPDIIHSALYNQALSRWPAEVKATVIDNLGIDSVWIEYRLNGGVNQYFDLNNLAGDIYSGLFPISASSLTAGDSIGYRIYAQDNSSIVNITQYPESGYLTFKIIDALGLAIVINDDQTSESTKEGKTSYIRPVEKLGMAALGFESVLQRMGYLVDNVSSSLVDTSTLFQYDLIISASGGDLTPVPSSALRTKLEEWVLTNPKHKLIIEGGEVGYDALFYPGYTSFATNVLHSYDWLDDNAGDLILNSNQKSHYIVTTPNQLPSTISINYSGWGDEDAVLPISDAYTIYNTQSYPNAGGIIIYDDDLDTTNAQIAYFAFNIDALSDTNIANDLIENTVTYLMYDASVSGIPNDIDNFPVEFKLLQNYPNPFNPQTTIKSSIPNESDAEIVIFNLLGQQIYKKNLKKLDAGWHKIVFDGSGLSSGIYFYSLKVKETSGKTYNQTRKMLNIQ